METVKLIAVFTLLALLVVAFIFFTPQEQPKKLLDDEFSNVVLNITVTPVELYEPITTNYRISISASMQIPASTTNLDSVESFRIDLQDPDGAVLKTGDVLTLDSNSKIKQTFFYSDFGDGDVRNMKLVLYYKMQDEDNFTQWGNLISLTSLDMDNVFNVIETGTPQSIIMPVLVDLDVPPAPVAGTELDIDPQVPYKFENYYDLFTTRQNKFTFHADVSEAAGPPNTYDMRVHCVTVSPCGSVNLTGIQLIPINLSEISTVLQNEPNSVLLKNTNGNYLYITEDKQIVTTKTETDFSTAINTRNLEELARYIFFYEDLRATPYGVEKIPYGPPFQLNPDGFTIVCFDSTYESNNPEVRISDSNNINLLDIQYNDVNTIDYSRTREEGFTLQTTYSSDDNSLNVITDTFGEETKGVYCIHTRDYQSEDGSIVYRVRFYYGDDEIFFEGPYDEVAKRFTINYDPVYFILPDDYNLNSEHTFKVSNSPKARFFNEPVDWTVDSSFKRYIQSRTSSDGS